MTILSGGLNTTGSVCRKHEKIEKVTGSVDDGFVAVLKKNLPNKLALMDLASWAKLSHVQPSLRD
jgi:hypothetical protein